MEYKKTTEVTGNLTGNKIANEVAKFLDGKIVRVSVPKERYISAEEIQKIIVDLTWI